jgi:TolA-binding protein
MRWPIISGLAIAAIMAVGATPARAQVDSREAIALQNQIYQLRQELQTMQEQSSRGGGGSVLRGPAPYQAAPSNDLLAQLLTRVDALEQYVRQLRGRMDETQNQEQRQNAELSKKIDDLAFQMQTQPNEPGGRSSNSPPFGSPPVATRPAPPSGPPQGPPPGPPQPRTPEIALQQGSAALARRDYTASEQSAREVLANRTSPRAYDAQLLLAQSLAGQKQFPQAAIAYDDAYNRSRKGQHAQDALLGLANSLAAINEKKAACDTVARLRVEFPQLRPDIRDASAATVQRAGCK